MQFISLGHIFPADSFTGFPRWPGRYRSSNCYHLAYRKAHAWQKKENVRVVRRARKMTTLGDPFLALRCCVNRLRVARAPSRRPFSRSIDVTTPGGSLTAECGTLFHSTHRGRVPFYFETGTFLHGNILLGTQHACYCCCCCGCCERTNECEATHTRYALLRPNISPHTIITVGFLGRSEWMAVELNAKSS